MSSFLGNKKISKVYIKSKVSSDFITAEASDIMLGKRSIDNEYNPITGSMIITDTLESLTSDATAVASDIDVGTTAYVNGVKITGTADRSNVEAFVNGIVESYKVANGNIIHAGDFVKFVDELCGCGNETIPHSSTQTAIADMPNGVVSLKAITISTNRVLIVYSSRTNNNIYCCTLTFSDISHQVSSQFHLGVATTTPMTLCRLHGTVFAIVYRDAVTGLINIRALQVNDDNTFTNVSSVSLSVTSTSFVTAVTVSIDKIFVAVSTSNNITRYYYVSLVDNVLVTTNISISSPAETVFHANRLTVEYLSETTLLLCREVPSANRSCIINVIDISAPSTIIIGPDKNITNYASISSNIATLHLNTNHVMVSCYVGPANTGYINIGIYKAEGLNLVDVSSTTLFTGAQLNNIVLNYLSPNYYNITMYNTNNIMMSSIINIDDSYNITIGNVFTTGVYTAFMADSVSHAPDKIQFIYINNSYKLTYYVLQRHNMTFITELLIDTGIPLTKKMVAISTDGIIDGIAINGGIGAIYGGDTINIKTPSFT